MAGKSKEKSSKRSDKKSAKSTTSESDCPHCKEGPEYYRMIYNLYKFDVDLARTIVADGRESLELEPEDVQHSLDWSRIHPPHLAHVDVQYPGIIAHYWYPEPDGTVLHGHVLIDGHHRAAKTVELDLPFFVRILTEEESKKVTVRSPDIEQILAKRRELAEDRLANVDRPATK